MSSFEFKGERLAIGLSWLAPDAHPGGVSAKRKQRTLLRKKPQPTGFVEIRTREGIQTGLCFEDALAGQPAAAALLAQKNAALVLIEPVEDNLYWLCAVDSGAVWPAGDVTGTRNQVRARLQEIMQDMLEPAVYDTAQDFDIEASEPVGFEDLVDTLPEDLRIVPLRKKIALKPLHLGAVAAIVIMSGTAGWFYYFADSPAPEPTVNLAKQRAAAGRQTEIEHIKQTLQQNPIRLIIEVINTVYDRPLRSGGWRQTEYEWADGTLTATWVNERGTIGSLTGTLPPGSWKLDGTGSRIFETIELAAPMKETPADLDELFEHADRFRFTDQIASLSGSWEIKPPVTVGSHYKVSRLPVSAGGLSVDASTKAVNSLTAEPFRITRLKWVLTRRLEISLEGEFYAPAPQA